MKHLAVILGDPKSAFPRQWAISIALSLSFIAVWVTALLWFGFSWPLYLVMITLTCAAVFVTPTAGLPIIILATMWFERWFTLQPIVLGDQIYKLYPLDIVLIFTAISLFFHFAFGKNRRAIPWRRMETGLLVFIAVCVLYFLASVTLVQSDSALAFSAFKNYAFYALLYFIVVASVRNTDDLRNLLKILFIGGLGIILFIVIGVVRGEGLWTEYTPLSTSGVRLLAFPHAFYLCLVLLISLVLFLYRLRPERTTLVLMWVQLFGVLGSLMRHLWISLAAVSAVVFVLLPSLLKKSLLRFFGKNLAVVSLAVVSLAFFMMVFPLSDATFKLQSITDPLYRRARSLVNTAADSSAQWRFFAWRAAQESFIDHPVLGIGYGRDLTIDFETYRRVVPIRELHNSYLVLLVQMGMVGLATFGYLLYRVCASVLKAYRGKGILWPYQLALFSAWLMFMAAAVWQPYFETNLTGIFFWILTGLLMVSLRLEEEESIHTQA